jgi:hypothetical protein
MINIVGIVGTIGPSSERRLREYRDKERISERVQTQNAQKRRKESKDLFRERGIDQKARTREQATCFFNGAQSGPLIRFREILVV